MTSSYQKKKQILKRISSKPGDGLWDRCFPQDKITCKDREQTQPTPNNISINVVLRTDKCANELAAYLHCVENISPYFA